jgi:hypothetical protein
VDEKSAFLDEKELTFRTKYATFFVQKGCDEDMRCEKSLREELIWWKSSGNLPRRYHF